MKENVRMKTKGLRAAIAALTIGALAIGAVPAQAGKAVKTKVKIAKLTADGGSGTVKSRNKKCVKGRKVTLKFVGEYGDVVVGKDKTDKAGAWAIDKALTRNGIYFATVKEKQAGKTTCAGGSSKDKRY
jgi:hypothetical protein